MTQDERSIGEALASAAKALPEDKREFLLGYAEGVAAMAEQQRNPASDGKEGA